MSFVYDPGITPALKTSTNVPKERNPIRNKYRKSLLHDTGRTGHKERTCFPASFLNASLTIEAALVLPLFLIFSLAVISFLMILSVQMDLQNGMEEIARNLTRKAYLAERSGADLSFAQPAAVSLMLQSGSLKERLDHSQIEGGAAGVNAWFSTYDAETGMLDIIVSYDYNILPLPAHISKLHFVQRVRSRAWIGRALDSAGDGSNGTSAEGSEEDQDTQTVYVTASGSVYHTSMDCTYLDLSIHNASFSQIDSLRNKSGSRYGRCPLCAKNAAETGTVYITDYGENWHTSLSCSGLKRTVKEMDLSEVKDLPLCSKCGARHAAGKEE